MRCVVRTSVHWLPTAFSKNLEIKGNFLISLKSRGRERSVQMACLKYEACLTITVTACLKYEWTHPDAKESLIIQRKHSPVVRMTFLNSDAGKIQVGRRTVEFYLANRWESSKILVESSLRLATRRCEVRENKGGMIFSLIQWSLLLIKERKLLHSCFSE